MNKNFKALSSIALMAGLVFTLGGCRVETNTESVPEAEGSGKKAINIRVEPMSKEEVKDVTNRAIDSSAEFAARTRDAATSAVNNMDSIGRAVTTLTDSINFNRSGDDAGDTRVTTSTTVTTDTN